MASPTSQINGRAPPLRLFAAVALYNLESVVNIGAYAGFAQRHSLTDNSPVFLA